MTVLGAFGARLSAFASILLRRVERVGRSRWAVVSLVACCLASPAPALANGFHTGHQFAVSESGAATLTVPIQVPRGIGGMEPQLALNYSSSAGNGLLGVGWTLSGPSAITRCPKTKALDGERGAVRFDANDRYCLDGQRLVLVDGTYGAANSEYRTERDTFSRITAQGSHASQSTVPLSFKVETKAGLILEFGISSNSRVLTNFVSGVSTTETINRWMLQRIADRHQNYVEFVYCDGEVTLNSGGNSTSCAGLTPRSGSTVLQYVRYTNRGSSPDGTFAVAFGYEARPDRIQGFHMGSAARQTQRINRIETRRDFASATSLGSLIRVYEITYEPIEVAGASVRATNTSRISQIQEKDASGGMLPPLTFAFAPDTVFDDVVRQRLPAGTGTPRLPPACGGTILGRVTLQCP